MNPSQKPLLELFFGFGGVGKTTLAVTRAIEYARRFPEKEILLATIDPSLRLKDFFGLSQVNDKAVQTSSIEGHPPNLKILLFSTSSVFSTEKSAFSGRILQVLTRPYGGMHEIFALVELEKHFTQGIYSKIIIDTAPGVHFLDFLKAPRRIQPFFQKSLVEVFKIFQRRPGSSETKHWKRAMKFGIQKLLDQLEKVTGEQFVDEFLIAVQQVHEAKDAFDAAIRFHQRIIDPTQAQWFTIFSAHQEKWDESVLLVQRAKNFSNITPKVLLNHCLEVDSIPSEQLSPEWMAIHHSFMRRQKEIRQKITALFGHFWEFPEVYETEQQRFLEIVSERWNRLEK